MSRPLARRRRLVTFLSAALLVATACSGDGGSGKVDADGSTATSTTSATTTTTAVVIGPDGSPVPSTLGTTDGAGGATASTAPARRGGAGATATTAPAATGRPADAAGAPDGGRLTEVIGFGTNPGRVRMFEYVPAGLGTGRPLVVVLHGCTQTAAAFDDESGWTDLADRHRFALVLPQQSTANNSSACWNFFLPSGNQRDQGEVLSIKQMVDWMRAQRGVDRTRIFATGLSAGGAMTNVLLATYPDVFKAGAPVAGVAFKCATDPAGSVACNQGLVDRTPTEWGDLVRAASSWKGPWPRVSVWHGTADGTVSPQAMPEIVEQWTNVHGTDQSADVSDTVAGYPHRAYRAASGAAVVESFTITGMGHGWPVDPRAAPPCGAVAPYFLDARICASSHIAGWFGLTG